jgi:hypothetical protein
MIEPNISMEQAIALMSVFEGLSLWKLPELMRKNRQDIEIEFVYEVISGDKEKSPIKKAFHTIWFYLFTQVFRFFHLLGKLLKYTIFIWGIVLPIVIFFIATRQKVSAFYTENCAEICWGLFVFVSAKALIALAVWVIAKLYESQYKKYISQTTSLETSAPAQFNKRK